jgi:hypothetical protein
MFFFAFYTLNVKAPNCEFGNGLILTMEQTNGSNFDSKPYLWQWILTLTVNPIFDSGP